MSEHLTVSVDDLANMVNHAHGEVVMGMRTTLEAARLAGQLLRQAKDQLRHGAFLGWLERHCPDITPRTAQHYMRVADQWSALEAKMDAQQVSHLTMRSALRMLATPKPKEKKQTKTTATKTTTTAPPSTAPPSTAPPAPNPPVVATIIPPTAPPTATTITAPIIAPTVSTITARIKELAEGKLGHALARKADQVVTLLIHMGFTLEEIAAKLSSR